MASATESESARARGEASWLVCALIRALMWSVCWLNLHLRGESVNTCSRDIPVLRQQDMHTSGCTVVAGPHLLADLQTLFLKIGDKG